MILSNELRIGNWVSDGYKEYYQISAEIINAFSNGETLVRPIELTEEWLIKFGFKQYTDFKIIYDLMPLCGFAYDTDTKQVIIQEKRNSMSHWIERKIEYVHELQNLYFALRGKELTITH